MISREDARKLLGENATDEQVNALLSSIHNEIKEKESQLKDLSDKLTANQSEIDKLKASDAELQKIKESQMTEQERAKALEEQLNAKMSEYNRLTNATKAKAILVGAGISSERADSLVSKFVKDDEQETLDLANDLVAEFNSIKEVTSKEVKDKLSSIDATPKGSNVNPKQEDGTMTWEKFQKLTSEEQNKFQEEHPQEFEAM